MVEVYLILTGLIFVAWIALLVWQARRSTGDDWSTGRPIVPVSLVEGDEAVIVAEERGRVVYANEQARAWFGMDGGAPSLALMAQAIQPADAFLDLFAHSGHAALRLGQRRLEGMSHPIPASGGARMVVILRELSAATSLAATELDPLRALTLQTDLAQTVSVDQVLGPTVDALLRVVEQAVPFDQAEVLLWHAETQTLRVVGRSAKLSATGSLIPPEDQEQVAIPVGEGYSGWIALYRQPLRIDDAPARSDYALRPGQMPFQSFAGIPLLLDDRLVGTLELTRRTPGAYSPGDIALLQAVAGQIVAVVEGARLRTEQAARMHELSGLQHISGAFSQLGDPQQLYAQITQRIAFLANVELCGIMLYDPDEETYRSQAPFYGVPESLVRGHRLEMAPDSDLYEAVMHRPWWYTNDPASPITAALRLDDVQSTIPLRRVAIVPMVIGTRRVGLLLVANKHGALRFNDADIRSLITFGNQAAMVVENARLYDDAQRRSRELGGLQQIAEAIGALRSPEQLYDQITRRVAELMDVELCGVLLYDPHTHVLVSQRPFYGLEDDETVSFYQLPSPPGSVIAELWQDRPMWYCNDLRRDPLVGDTDLVRMAGALGIRQMALAPLVVRGARRGMIQVANKRGGDFSEDDARILSLFAGQAAILIDNAQLYGEMQRRTHQAEGLRVITEFASQTRSLDEMIEQILIALANLYEAGQVAIALVDEARGQLVVEPGNFWGVALDERLAIDLAGPDVAQSALIGRQPVISAAGAKAGSIPAAYQAVARRLGWRDVAQVPLVIRDQVIGELTIANRTDAEPYHDTDIQLLSAIATQVAAMIDRMRLYQSTDELLRARVETLERLGHISRALRQTTEIDRLLDEVIRVALRSTGARSVSVTLLAPAEDWPAPDEPLIERRVGEQDTLPDLAPLERAAITQGDLIAVDDYAASEWAPAPVLARSAVSVPLVIDGAPLGVLHLIGGEPGAFDARAREFAAVLAAETALAVASSRRYQAQLEANHQLRMRADRMDRIFEVGELFRRGASLEELLAEVAESVRESVGFSSVLISLVDEEAGVMRRTAYAGLPRAAFEQLRRVTPPLEQARGLMQPEYQVSHSYFLPAEGSEALIEGLPTLQVVEERMGPGARAWHPDDLLLIPLYGAGGRLLGLMSVDDPRSGRRPDQATVEALEAFAGQAAFSIENFRLIARIQHEAEATRRERDRLAQLHLVASEIQRAADVPARLQVVADGIHQAGWGKVFITLRDERLEPTALIQAGYSPEEAPGLEIEPGKVWRAWIGDLAFHELKLGAGYYLRYDQPWVRQHVYGGQPPVPAEVGPGEWHPEDTLYLTLVGQDQKRIIGIIGMREPVDGRVPTTSSLQPFELFASQAAAAIETTRLYLETVRAAEQEARFNALMEAVAVSMRPEAVIEAIAVGLQQVVPFTRLHVALGDPDAPQLDLWRATIALDGTLSVGREDPLPAPDTA
ncbi:MAG: GAF domain-containing protein, partial [Anaerolineae bacterium]|nr:GAF domain-containing protein [Anaerolineae bacterium]